MHLDLIVAGILVLFGLLGLSSGVLAQLPNLLALVVAWLATQPLSTALTPLALKRFGGSPTLMGLAVSLVLFSVLSASVAVFTRIALGKLFADRQHGKADHGLGFALGAAKAGAVIYLALAAYVSAAGPTNDIARGLAGELDASKVVAFVRQHNALGSHPLPQMASLQKMLGGGGAAPAGGAGIGSLLNDPRFQAALSSGNASGLMNSPEMRQMLKDPQIQQLLNNPDIQKMLNSPDLANQLGNLKPAQPANTIPDPTKESGKP